MCVLEHIYLVFGADCFEEGKSVSPSAVADKEATVLCGDCNFTSTFAKIFFPPVKQWTRERLKFNINWKQPVAVPIPNPNYYQPTSQFVNEVTK